LAKLYAAACMTSLCLNSCVILDFIKLKSGNKVAVYVKSHPPNHEFSGFTLDALVRYSPV
jgi:hypothetical protein